MTDWRSISDCMANALRRVQPYLDLVPATAGDDVLLALAKYDVAVAETAIVQKAGVKPHCAHESYQKIDGRCVGCGELVPHCATCRCGEKKAMGA